MAPSPTVTPDEFVAKWAPNAGRERSSSQEHFIDLCHMLGVPTPNDADPTAKDEYAFEKGASKTGGGDGWADVWKRGYFGWEYKGKKHPNLPAAYKQLLDYREDLENPPVLVVCDMDLIEVHTNFTNTAPQILEVRLSDLTDNTEEALRILRSVMSDPEALRPGQTPEEITEAAASQFAVIARSMQDREHAPEDVAHFLNRVLFCLFAEDVGLLPERIVTELIEGRWRDPVRFAEGLSELFRHMSYGGHFGVHEIAWFNGGLFTGDEVLEFTREELGTVAEASGLDWSRVEPAILGTLFERGLDPEKRAQLGAHYTDREKILMVVEPVVMRPLRREFEEMQQGIETLAEGQSQAPLTRDGRRRANLPKWERDAQALYGAYLDRLRAVRVLDPACGSGNFLYVTLGLLKDLERDAMRWGAERLRLIGQFPEVGPQNMLGIEINPYARGLASVSLWIGHIQWMRNNGFGYPRDPVLGAPDNIEQRDAILTQKDEEKPISAEWPQAEFIVGNPPFLGDRRMREQLGDEYVDRLRSAYLQRVPAGADLVCYWYEQARSHIEGGFARRAGLLATSSIRKGQNNKVVKRISESGALFEAWSAEDWVVEGAAVEVSIVGFDDGRESLKRLDGEAVDRINSDLTTGSDLTQAVKLRECRGLAFMGDIKAGSFEMDGDDARRMLGRAGNPNGRPNADVISPWINAEDLVRRPRDRFIVDFPEELSLPEAALYEAPFAWIRDTVPDQRVRFGKETWWIHWNPRPALRSALGHLDRYVAIPRVSKHHALRWQSTVVLPDSAVVAVSRSDDYAFGVLQSRSHEYWALRRGSSLEDRPRYTHTSVFETFPFPWPLNTPDDGLTVPQQAHRDAIGEAARKLNETRERWLNPPQLVREEPDVVDSLPPRLLPVDDEAAEELKTRTLTNLYNSRPAWLEHLHATLDRAVFDAYGWDDDPTDEQILERLLRLNLERAAAQDTE